MKSLASLQGLRDETDRAPSKAICEHYTTWLEDNLHNSNSPILQNVYVFSFILLALSTIAALFLLVAFSLLAQATSCQIPRKIILYAHSSSLCWVLTQLLERCTSSLFSGYTQFCLRKVELDEKNSILTSLAQFFSDPLLGYAM